VRPRRAFWGGLGVHTGGQSKEQEQEVSIPIEAGGGDPVADIWVRRGVEQRREGWRDGPASGGTGKDERTRRGGDRYPAEWSR